MNSADLLDPSLRPQPLLPVRGITDFSRNFRQFEKAAKRPYSIAKVIRELGNKPSRLTGFEMEVHQELHALNRDNEPIGVFIPMEVLSRRDLTLPSGAVSVQRLA